MLLIPVPTRKLKKGDPLGAILTRDAGFNSGDILVISSKAIATTEGSALDIHSLVASQEASVWSQKTGRSPEFCEAVLQETKRLNGRVAGHCTGALLTEVKPEGLAKGTILTANAGLDESNVAGGEAIGWPHHPDTYAEHLRRELGGNIAIIVSDSNCRPRRIGVTAFALAVSGIDPFRSEVGSADLFGKNLSMTVESTADQLATAANMLMGNAAQSIPVVIARDHGLTLSDFTGWVDGIEPTEDLFRALY